MPAAPVRGTRALLALRRPQEGRGHCWRCGRPEKGPRARLPQWRAGRSGLRRAGRPAQALGDGAGLPWVTPTHRLGSGSHLVASLPAAQALAVVAAEVEAVEVGDELPLIPLSAS